MRRLAMCMRTARSPSSVLRSFSVSPMLSKVWTLLSTPVLSFIFLAWPVHNVRVAIVDTGNAQCTFVVILLFAHGGQFDVGYRQNLTFFFFERA